MASNPPVIKQVAWISLIPQIAFMLILIAVYNRFGFEDAGLYGALTYLSLSMGLRYFIPKNHREGIKLTKNNQFEKAISEYEKSYDFFTNNEWIDKYRYITLLSSSKMNYREMALCNIAFCYSQIGNGTKAIAFYKKTLEEFPENGLAHSALKMLNSTIDIKN
jgi:tetratricopeptide (TPR) repeat protein